MQISNKMLDVKQHLLNKFSEIRNSISSSATDSELILNDDFKKCYLINFLLLTIFSDEIAYEAAELFLEQNDYNIDSLFDNYIIYWDNNINNFKIDLKEIN